MNRPVFLPVQIKLIHIAYKQNTTRSPLTFRLRAFVCAIRIKY